MATGDSGDWLPPAATARPAADTVLSGGWCTSGPAPCSSCSLSTVVLVPSVAASKCRALSSTADDARVIIPESLHKRQRQTCTRHCGGRRVMWASSPGAEFTALPDVPAASSSLPPECVAIGCLIAPQPGGSIKRGLLPLIAQFCRGRDTDC